MKNFILLFFLFPLFLFSQDLSIWQNMRTSAVTSQDSVYFRCETTPDAMNFTKHLYHFSNNQWNIDSLQYLNGTTFQSKFPANSDSANIRISMESDNIFYGMSAFISDENSVPPLSFLGECGADSVNEIEPQYDECLDITKQYTGFNNQYIYGGMTTNDDISGSGGWTGPYYIYGYALANPVSAIQDSIGYAMIYAEIPVLITPGLYKIHYNSENPLEGISRIGDIDYDISGNQLTMKASLDDLINDPDFGEWAFDSKYLLSSTFTMNINLPSDFTMADYGVPAVVELKKFMVNTSNNNLPAISSINNIGNIITCSYFDIDSNFPLTHEVITDSGDIFELIPSGFDYSDNVQFTTTITSPNWNSAIIRFSDNNIDFVDISLENTNSDDNSIPNDFHNIIVYPNPFIFGNSRNQVSIKFYSPNIEMCDINFYNIRGQKIENIFTGKIKKGENKIVSSINKTKISSGIYFIGVKSQSVNKIQKLMILK